MLNVKATPCEKSKAIVLSKGHFGFNKFADDLEEAKPDAFDLFFELIKGADGLHLLSMYSYRKSNPKRWYRFLKFCKKDGRIKVYRKNNKMVYEVPTSLRSKTWLAGIIG
jgi:hypothetical protein